MKIQFIKDIIIENPILIKDILEDCNCHNIQDYGLYYGFSYPDGDNKKGGIIYKNTLILQSYTRSINGNDFLSLIQYLKNENFYKTLQYISNFTGISDYKENKSEFFELLNKLSGIKENNIEEEPIKTYDENILKYYLKIGNSDFEKDGIDLKTQKEFEIGFCTEEHLITIPIRDVFGGLVGVKARKTSWIDNYDFESKYIYIEKCPKSKILYGLNKTYEFIKEKNEIILVESEKSVMKLWQYGYKNSVAIGGHMLSKYQIKMIKMMNVDVVFAFDEDISVLEIEKEVNKLDNIKNVCYIDNKGLKEKESPVDLGFELWTKKYKERKLVKNGL